MKNNQCKKDYIILMINFILLILCLIFLSLTIVFYNDNSSIYMLMFCVVLFTLYFFTSSFGLSQTKRIKNILLSLEQSKLHIKTLQTLYDGVRSFKHDFFNIMQSIEGYIKTHNPIALQKYYDEIKLECDNFNSLSALDPETIDEPALYNLINAKYHKAEQNGISFDMKFLVKFSTLGISPYSFSKILGILLDNAIEAAKDSKEKKIILEVMPRLMPDSSKRHINITIENSYSNKDVDLSRISEKGFTSKNDDSNSHGLGLWNVQNILKKYDNLSLHTSKDKDFFKQVLEIS